MLNRMAQALAGAHQGTAGRLEHVLVSGQRVLPNQLPKRLESRFWRPEDGLRFHSVPAARIPAPRLRATPRSEPTRFITTVLILYDLAIPSTWKNASCRRWKKLGQVFRKHGADVQTGGDC